MNYVLQGWPASNADDERRPYISRLLQLSLHDGCLLWGNRVVIPTSGQETIMQKLHAGHPGVTRVKMLARSYVWWLKMDLELENKVNICHEYLVNRHATDEAPWHPWEWPEKNHGLEYISITLVRYMVKCFCDNGTPFISKEFESFLKKNGIRHIRISPYQSSSNGLADRAVQMFKEGLKKMMEGIIETRIARFVFAYRITPHATTGLPPSVMLMGRRPRSLLD
ncbi:Hypothetical predicted protein [Mytilus galloprovincialis]|uniref:Integrase catalytic domain-containing protein n=1 Tax=Mytilus galloprovincialis TaxID=29158 RepID=A0A8B6G7U2_MYTGA|nr:Hypothetical predicted protein [Mytilus galloprovincialis]